jgi:hypothetical protein
MDSLPFCLWLCGTRRHARRARYNRTRNQRVTSTRPVAPPLTLGRTPRTQDGILNFQLDAHQGSIQVTACMIPRCGPACRPHQRERHSLSRPCKLVKSSAMQSEIGTTRRPNGRRTRKSLPVSAESHVNRAETPDALSIRYTALTTAQRQCERVIVTRSITRRPCPSAQQLCCDLIPAP